ncbi:hypothetical protein ABNF65_08010 [Paenibacillus larvae]
MTTEFFMPMKKVPTVTHQQKQVTVVNNKPVFYEPPELKAARAKLIAHLGQHVPEKTYARPVRFGASRLLVNGRTANTSTRSRISTTARSCCLTA